MVKSYFNELNYTLGNEDSRLEASLVKAFEAKNIFSIAGCGSRAFPLLNENVEQLVMADFSPFQLHLCELRAASYICLDHESFLKFWGFPPFSTYNFRKFRKDKFHSFELSDECRDFFEGVFNEVNWDSILYLGKWEKTFKTLCFLMKKIMGKGYDQIMLFDSLDEQVSFYHNKFSLNKWKAVLFLLGNKSVFNALLYKGDFIKKNVSETHFQYYFDAFERLFTQGLVGESFFAHLCFYGEINHPDGITIEAEKSNFAEVQKKLRTSFTPDYWQGDMVGLLSKSDKVFDFLSLSDVPSYFSGDTERNYLQEIKRAIAPGGHIVLRHYLRVPESNNEGYEDVTFSYSDFILKEKVQMYKVQILRKL